MPSSLALKTAFTTIELVIVIGTLVLLLAMAVPAFNFIMGNRSTQAAENIVSAMLGRARGYAIANQCYAGIAFFHNPSTERTTLAMVVQKMPGGAQTEDPFPAYKGWSQMQTGVGIPTDYSKGDEVVAMVADQAEGKFIARGYFAKVAHTSSGMSAPPQIARWTAGSTAVNGPIDIIADTDLEPLQPGVACQLVNSPSNPNLVLDRYVRTGAIMFDPQGALANIPLLIPQGSQLAALIQNQMDPTQQVAIPGNTTVNNGLWFRSQVGVALYKRDEFRGQGFQDPTAGTPWQPVDDCLGLQPNTTYTMAASGRSQQEEEAWLDQNAEVLLVSRYNGTLIKGE